MKKANGREVFFASYMVVFLAQSSWLEGLLSDRAVVARFLLSHWVLYWLLIT